MDQAYSFYPAAIITVAALIFSYVRLEKLIGLKEILLKIISKIRGH
jgi:hypothetical protein